MKPPSNSPETNPFTQGSERPDTSGHVFSSEISSAEVGDWAVSAHEAADGAGGHALEEAAKYLQTNPNEPNKFGFAQRAMESMLQAGEWSDETRQAAEDMNTAQRLKDGRPAKAFEGALAEMSSHAETWLRASNTDGSADEWLKQEGITLAHNVNLAASGSVESVDFLLKTVEGLLAHRGRLTEQERQSEMYRDLRDALFEKKKQLMAAEASKLHEDEQRAQVSDARSAVESVFTGPKPEDTIGQEDVPKPVELDTKTPEERDFLKGLALIRGDFKVSQIAELGFTRAVFTGLTTEQQVTLTGIFKDAHHARMHAVGPEAIRQVKDVLVQRIGENVKLFPIK